MRYKSRIKLLLSNRAITILLAIILVISIAQSAFFRADAAKLIDRSLELSSSTISAINTQYTIRFTIGTASLLGSLYFEFCSNDPYPLTPCNAPIGLDVIGAVLASQTGQVGFTIDPSSTVNKIVLTRAPSPATIIPVSYVFTGIKNPSITGTFYGRLVTFASNDATGVQTDTAGVASAITNNFSLNTEVPQFLEFCSGVTITNFDCLTANGSFIDFGILKSASASVATSQFMAATNAGFGYNIGIYGLTMTSGTNTIALLPAQTFSAPGNNQFGINVVANTLPAIGANPVGPGIATVSPNYAVVDQFKFNSGDLVVSSIGSSDYRKFTTTYLTNVTSAQPAGVYTTTLTYICLANF